MENIKILKFDHYYHIYNKGVNDIDLFREHKDYYRFLNLMDKYLLPVSTIYAWALIPNHFHILLKTKKVEELDIFKGLKYLLVSNRQYFVIKHSLKIPNLSKQVSNLCNAYAKYYNIKYRRRGTLFERPFKRKLIDNKYYFKRLVLYIHYNPVHHKFCEHPLEYPWTSYLSCISMHKTKIDRNTVVGWFDNLNNFKRLHNGNIEVYSIDEWLEI